MKTKIRACAALGAALVFAGCGGDKFELEKACSVGDEASCEAIGMHGRDWSPGLVEPATSFLNADPPQHFLAGEQLSDTLGQAHQAFSGTQLWGYRTATTGAPGFQDPFTFPPTGFGPTGICGVTSDKRTCLFPKGPDLKTTWTWSWRRGFQGSSDPSCDGLNGNDDFLFGIRDAMALWSQGTGLIMKEVANGQEEITLFCDGLTESRIDPKGIYGAAWGAFGATNGPQADDIHNETADCASTGRVVPLNGGGQAYVYSSAGIIINPSMFTDETKDESWSTCAGFNTDPAPLRSLGKIVILHEMAHHFGFNHFDSNLSSMQWIHPRLECATAMEHGVISEIPQQFADTLKNFVSQRRQESINFPAGQGFQKDGQLLCLDPDETTNPIE